MKRWQVWDHGGSHQWGDYASLRAARAEACRREQEGRDISIYDLREGGEVAITPEIDCERVDQGEYPSQAH